MSDLSILDQITSVEEIVRNYRAIFDKVKKSGKPIIVLRRNIPDIALVTVDWLKETEKKLNQSEEEKALHLIREGKKEFKQKKAKILKSITSLMKKNGD